MASNYFISLTLQGQVAMNYNSYKAAIIKCYKIWLTWPSNCNWGVITNPTKLSVDDIHILHQAWEIGTCRWGDVDMKESKKENKTGQESKGGKQRSDAGGSRKRKGWESRERVGKSQEDALVRVRKGGTQG